MRWMSGATCVSDCYIKLFICILRAINQKRQQQMQIAMDQTKIDSRIHNIQIFIKKVRKTKPVFVRDFLLLCNGDGVGSDDICVCF